MLHDAAGSGVGENTDPDVLDEPGHYGSAKDQAEPALVLEFLQVLCARNGCAGQVRDGA